MKPILDGLNQTLKQPVLSETVCLTLLPTGKMPLEIATNSLKTIKTFPVFRKIPPIYRFFGLYFQGEIGII